MPNWCVNHLVITGKNSDIYSVEQFLRKKQDTPPHEAVDFNNVSPMPEPLKQARSGSDESSYKILFPESGCEDAVKNFLNSFLEINKEIDKRFVVPDAIVKKYSEQSIKEFNAWIKLKYPGLNENELATKCYEEEEKAIEYRDNFIKYGHTTWYSWACKHWGTKWNASYSTLKSYRSNRLSYCFLTAWSPPIPVIKRLSAIFTELKITLRYYESGAGYKGVYCCKNEECLTDSTSSYSGRRGG